MQNGVASPEGAAVRLGPHVQWGAGDELVASVRCRWPFLGVVRAAPATLRSCGSASALWSADGVRCFVVALLRPEHGGYEDLHAHLVGLHPLLWLDQFSHHGGDGVFIGGGRHGGGAFVGPLDVAEPDGAGDLKHGVDVLLVVVAACSDDDVGI